LTLPKLTWNFDPLFASLPLAGLGTIRISYYGLLFSAALLGGYALLHWQVRRGGGTAKDDGDFVPYAIVGVLVGARLGHMLFYDLDRALADPLLVLRIWTGGLASHGAAVGLILATFVYTRRRRVPFLEGLDRLAFSTAFSVALVRVGNFLNSEIVGRQTDQTWGVQFLRYPPDQSLPAVPYRHPAQLYEAGLGLVVLAALFIADRAWGQERRPRGALISLAGLLYFAGRFFLEFIKEYQTLAAGSLLTMGQWLSIPCAALAAWGLWWSFQRRLPAGWTPQGSPAAK